MNLVQIEQADGRLLESVAAAMREAARLSGNWLACRPGCNQCCLGSFDITLLDELRLRRGMRELERADPARAAAVRKRAAAHREGDDEPCPVLDPSTGLCDLYEWRPMTCRAFGPATVTDDGAVAACELCYEGATEAQIAACAVELDGEGVEQMLIEELAASPGLCASAIASIVM